MNNRIINNLKLFVIWGYAKFPCWHALDPKKLAFRTSNEIQCTILISIQISYTVYNSMQLFLFRMIEVTYILMILHITRFCMSVVPWMWLLMLLLFTKYSKTPAGAQLKSSWWDSLKMCLLFCNFFIITSLIQNEMSTWRSPITLNIIESRLLTITGYMIQCNMFLNGWVNVCLESFKRVIEWECSLPSETGRRIKAKTWTTLYTFS